MIKSTLDFREQQMAAFAALSRLSERRARGVEKKNVYTRNEITTQFCAAGAEPAAAKIFNQYWAGIGDPTKPDVGPHIEVKWTDWENGYLAIDKDNPDDWIYVLVRGDFPEYEIVGWIKGKDGKQEHRWTYNENTGNWFYKVLEHELTPIHNAREALKAIWASVRSAAAA
jgi:hypothetical protein